MTVVLFSLKSIWMITAALFRTSECKDYFKSLLDGFIQVHGEMEVFRFRYQNWCVVDCETMIDELWTVLEATK